jgi:hypothetical protein
MEERKRAFVEFVNRRRMEIEYARGRRYRDFEVAKMIGISPAAFSEHTDLDKPKLPDAPTIPLYAKVFGDGVYLSLGRKAMMPIAQD